MTRPLWKGTISFGLVSIPVRVYSATRSNDLRFRQLDRQDASPIRERRISESTGREVPWDDIVKGYEYEKGSFVVLDPEDFTRANVKATETIEIMQAVPRDAVGPEYFMTPYFVVPAKSGIKPYHLLREALLRTERSAIATVVMRGHQHLAALLANEHVLMLELLRFSHELKAVSDLELDYDISAAAPTPKEIELAELLVTALDAPWQPERYRDEYRDDLLALIEQKAKRGTAPTRNGASAPQDTPSEVIDIMELLKKSVGQARDRKRPRTRRAAS
ncbi:MAG: Ku protein [Actinobacteria bacterium]|nr:Ku protein [Actinomycetota bacterium]